MIIIIGFSKAKSSFALFSRAIELVERTPYSHAYVRFVDPRSNVETVFQASHGMVNLYNYDRFLEKNLVIKEYGLPCTEDQFNGLWLFIVRMLGTRYGWLQLMGIALNKLIHVQNPFKDQLATQICSELAARVCAMLGVKMTEDFDSTDPRKLDQILMDNI